MLKVAVPTMTKVVQDKNGQPLEVAPILDYNCPDLPPPISPISSQPTSSEVPSTPSQPKVDSHKAFIKRLRFAALQADDTPPTIQVVS